MGMSDEEIARLRGRLIVKRTLVAGTRMVLVCCTTLSASPL
jgi:hypothetical protein